MDPIRSKDSENTSGSLVNQTSNGTNGQGIEEPQYSTANYGNYQPPSKPGRNWRKPLLILLGITLVLAAGFGAYSVIKKKPTGQSSKTQSQTHATQAKSISATTKNYASQNFTLSFDYPDDWTISDEQGKGIMTVKSPAVTLTDAGGQEIIGQITLTFRNKTQKLTEFDAGSATAARDSAKIAYTKPTQNQRGETYVSYLRYAKTAGSTLDGVYITGNSGYKKDQTVPLVDMTKVDPVVSLTFAKCSDASCTNATPANIVISSWDDTNLSGPLLAMLKSLTIQ